MIESIELQVISKLLTSQNEEEIENLLSFDETYYSIYKPHIRFIFNHRIKYGNIPDIFTFLSEFQDIDSLLDVREPFEYLKHQMNLNKQRIMLVDMFNRIKDADQNDIENVWAYISNPANLTASYCAYLLIGIQDALFMTSIQETNLR